MAINPRTVEFEHEVGTEDGRNRAARAEVRHSTFGRSAEEQRHRRLRHGRDKSAGEVEGQIPEVAERVSTFFPNTARKTMLPRM
jgi:hypothetical protein